MFILIIYYHLSFTFRNVSNYDVEFSDQHEKNTRVKHKIASSVHDQRSSKVVRIRK